MPNAARTSGPMQHEEAARAARMAPPSVNFLALSNCVADMTGPLSGRPAASNVAVANTLSTRDESFATQSLVDLGFVAVRDGTTVSCCEPDGPSVLRRQPARRAARRAPDSERSGDTDGV